MDVLPLAAVDSSHDSWANHRGDVGYLIKETVDLIVYLDKDGEVEWETTDEYYAGLNHAELGKVSNRIAFMRALPLVRLGGAEVQSFRVMLAEGMARALEAEFASAHDILNAAEEFFLARIREVARLWYLGGAASVLVLGIGGCLALMGARQWGVEGAGRLLGSPLLIGGLWGSVGALVSTIQGSQLVANGLAGPIVHRVDGALRLVLGVAGGLVVCLGLRAGVLLPRAAGADVLPLLAFAAGFGERFVPSIVERVGAAFLDSTGRIRHVAPGMGGKTAAS